MRKLLASIHFLSAITQLLQMASVDDSQCLARLQCHGLGVCLLWSCLLVYLTPTSRPAHPQPALPPRNSCAYTTNTRQSVGHAPVLRGSTFLRLLQGSLQNPIHFFLATCTCLAPFISLLFGFLRSCPSVLFRDVRCSVYLEGRRRFYYL